MYKLCNSLGYALMSWRVDKYKCKRNNKYLTNIFLFISSVKLTCDFPKVKSYHSKQIGPHTRKNKYHRTLSSRWDFHVCAQCVGGIFLYLSMTADWIYAFDVKAATWTIKHCQHCLSLTGRETTRTAGTCKCRIMQMMEWSETFFLLQSLAGWWYK